MFDVQVPRKMTRILLNDYFEVSKATVIQNILQTMENSQFGSMKCETFWLRVSKPVFDGTSAGAGADVVVCFWYCYCCCCCFSAFTYHIPLSSKQISRSIVIVFRKPVQTEKFSMATCRSQQTWLVHLHRHIYKIKIRALPMSRRTPALPHTILPQPKWDKLRNLSKWANGAISFLTWSW